MNAASSPSRHRVQQLLRGTALAGAAFGVLTATSAFAQDECGTPANGSVTCTADDNPYPNGISYTTPDDLTVVLDNGVAVESGDNAGVMVRGTGDAAVVLDGADGTSITTTGDGAFGVIGNTYTGDLTISVDSVDVSGLGSGGIQAASFAGDVSVSANDVSESGNGGVGIQATSALGNVAITADTVSSTGDFGGGITGYAGYDVTIDAGTVTTTGGAFYSYGARGIAAHSDFGNVTVTADTVTTAGDYAEAIHARAFYDSSVTAGTVSTDGVSSNGIYSVGVYGDASASGETVTTSGDDSAGMLVGSFYGDATATSTGSVTTSGDGSTGVFATSVYGVGDATVTVHDVSTTGPNSPAVVAQGYNATVTSDGSIYTAGEASSGVIVTAINNASVDVGDVTTLGDGSTGINAQNVGGYTFDGMVNVTADSVTTSGDYATGIRATSNDNGSVTVDVGDVSTSGYASEGVRARATYGNVGVYTGTVSTEGDYANGVIAISDYGDATVGSTGSVSTLGDDAVGLAAISSSGIGNASVTVNDVSTAGDNSTAIFAYGANANVTVNGDVSTEGVASQGVYAYGYDGDANVVNNGSISTVGDNSPGIYAHAFYDVVVSGTGTVSTAGENSRGIDASSVIGNVTVGTGDITTEGNGSQGIHAEAAFGDVTVDAASITTQGDASDGIGATSAFGTVDVTSTGAISTAGDNSFGVYAISTFGDANVTVNDVTTTGDDSQGVQAAGYNASVTVNGDLSTSGTVGAIGYGAAGVVAIGNYGTADVTINGSVTTAGDYATGVYATSAYGTTVTNAGDVATGGMNADGINVFTGYGPTVVNNTGTVSTTGESSRGIVATGYGDVSVAGDGSVSTTGDFSAGIAASTTLGYASVEAGSVSTTGDISTGITVFGSYGATVDVGSVSTQGDNSFGILAGGDGDIRVSAGSVTTAGDDSDGIRAATFTDGTSITIDAGDVATTGADSNAIHALGFGGAVDIRITGDVSSAQSDAVDITAATNATVSINSGASVTGAVDSILVDAVDGTTINNSGTINTGSGYAIDALGGPVLLINSGRINGRVSLTDGDDLFNNRGTFQVVGNSDFGGGADVFNNSGTVTVPLNGTAPVNVTLAGLETFNNSGLINLSNGVAGDRLTLPGSYTGSGNAALSLDLTGVTADRLNVGTAAGGTEVTLTPYGNLSVTPGITIVQAGASSPAGAFTLAPDSQSFGLIDYDLVYDSDTFAYQLVGTPGATVYRLLKATEGAQTLWYRTADAVSSHLTSLRDASASDQSIGSGIWFQMQGGVDKRDDTRTLNTFGITRAYNLDYKQDYFGGQGGVDLGSMGENGGVTFGVTAGYMNSVMRFGGSGDRFNYDVVNGGLYASLRAGPLFVNALGKYDYYMITAHSLAGGFSYDFNGQSYGGEINAGVRFGSNSFFVEPIVGLAYVRTDLDDIVARGSRIELDDMDGLRGKAGARIGGTTEIGNGNVMTFYASGEAIKEFKGDNGGTFVSGAYALNYGNDRIPLYGRGKIGFNITTPGGVTGFIEAQGDYSDDYKGAGGRAGIRVRF